MTSLSSNAIFKHLYIQLRFNIHIYSNFFMKLKQCVYIQLESKKIISMS